MLSTGLVWRYRRHRWVDEAPDDSRNAPVELHHAGGRRDRPGAAGGDPVFERVEASIVLGTVGAPLNHFVSQVGLDGGFSAELLVDCLSAGSSPPTCLFRGF